MPACGILRNHDEKNTTYIIARFDSVLQGIWVQNYSADDGKVLLEMSAILRDVSRALYFDLQSAYVPRGRYEDAAASSTAPCGLDVLAVQATYDLQSADFLCLFIRNDVWLLGFLLASPGMNTTSYV